MRQSIILFLIVLSVIVQTLQSQTFVHPGIPFTRNDLDQLKENVAQGKEPWASMYTSFANDAKSKLTYSSATPPSLVSRTPDINLTQWRNDTKAIFQLSLMWYFTGDTAYGGKATRLLDAWAVNNVQWAGEESFLDIGDYIEYLVPGADILKSTYPGWTAENTAHVNNYFANVIWPELDVPHPVRPMNQGAIQLKAAVSIAAFLDDPEKWQQAIFSLRYDPAGGLANSLENGQVGDAGRDEGHWRGQVMALAWSAEVAWKQGVDIFSELDKRILKAVELYARGPAGVEYIPFGGPYAFYTGFTNNANNQNGPAWNIVNGAYSLRKGLSCPYTDRLRSLVGNNIYTWLYLKSADNSTAKPPVRIVSPPVSYVSNLTNFEIGNTGLAGNSSYNNGVWSVTGAGKGVEVPYRTQPDALHFAFKQLSGDASVIAKFDSYKSYDESAQFGLMIREDLTPESKYATVLFTGNGGLVATWRGVDAWNKTNISWNFSDSRGSQTMSTAGRYPHWLKLERIGNRVVLSHAIDSIHWSNISVVDIPLSNTAYIGLAAASGNASALNTFEFSRVYITNTSSSGAPVLTSSTKANGVLGTAFSYVIEGTNSPSSYSAEGLPSGLSLSGNSITGSPLATGTFLVTIGATNESGTGTAVLVLTIADNAVPSAPTGVSASAVNVYQVDLSWNAVANATSYRVKRSSTAGGSYTTIDEVTGTSYVDVTAAPASDNYYVITALAGSLESTASSEVSVTIMPGVPTGLAVVNGTGKVDINWTAATGAAGYNIKRSTTAGGPYTTIASNITNTSYSDEGLINGTIYYYVVSSVAPQGESANSSEKVGIPGSTAAVWLAKPTSKNWNLASNWESAVIPSSPVALGFGASDTLTLNNNIDKLQVTRLVFNQGAGAYTLNGDTINIGTEITNNSTSQQVINLPLIMNSTLNVNPDSGRINLNGKIEGTGRIVINHPRDVTAAISGLNTYSGGTIIYGGWNGSWGPTHNTLISGAGTGAIGAPTAGPLGTGAVYLRGATLANDYVYAKIYNDIYVEDDNYLVCNPGGLELAGRLFGGGNLSLDVNYGYPYYTLSGDNSGFTGKFTTIKRSGYFRMAFASANAGSANAKWEFNANFNADNARFAFTGTIHFGEFAGEGSIRQFSGAPVISMGALNTDATYSGVAANNLSFIKTGTGTQRFTGANSYTGTTTVNSGKFYVNGSITSPVIVNGGIFGGTGSSTQTIAVNTGGTLAPGDEGIGGFKTTNAITMAAGSAFAVELSSSTGVSDKLTAQGVNLNDATLNLTDLQAGSLPMGTNLTIIENTAATAVNGTFNGLAEYSVITIGSNNYIITYRGGTGNDVVLMDERTVSARIISAATANGTVGAAFTYNVLTNFTATSYSVTGLPAGLSIDGATGIIFGTPADHGIFNVDLSAVTSKGTAALTIKMVIMTIETPEVQTGLSATGISSSQIVVKWNPSSVNDFVTGYTLKRSLTEGGPYINIATGITDTIYTDGNLAYNTTYYYVVSATNSVGEGAISSRTSAATNNISLPHVPANVMAVGGSSKIAIRWNASYEAAHYYVKRATVSGGPYTTIKDTTSLNIADKNVTAGTRYYYVVSAVNDMGESANSQEVTDTTTTGALRYWTFNENAGTSSTDVWNGQVGTFVNTAGTTWVPGVSGSAVNLSSASGSYVSLPTGIVNGLTDFTISAWVKPTSISTWMRIFDFGTGTNNYMFLSVSNGSVVRFAMRTSSVTEAANGINGTAISAGVWSHIAVTMQGTVGVLYINGIEAGRNNTMTLNPSSLGNTTQNWIGRSMWPDPYLDGSVDDFRIYSRALNASEISGMLASVTPMPPSNISVTGSYKNVTVSWNASSEAVAYNVKRAMVSGGPYTKIASGVTGTSYKDATATYGNYYYVVTSLSSTIEGLPSNEGSISLPSAVPTSFLATGWNKRVDLSWAPAQGAMGYDIKRATVSGGPYVSIDTVTTTIFSDTNVVNSTVYYYVIASIGLGGTSANSKEASAVPVDDAVSNGWSHSDVGAVGISGNAEYKNGIYTVYGSGSDLINQADAYHIMYKKLSGNAAIVARIVDQQSTASFAKAGVIISDTLTANTINAVNVSFPSGNKEFTYRTGTTTNSVETFYDNFTGSYQNVVSAHWLRLVRSGDLVNSYYSENGINWTLQKSQTLTMSGNIFIGMLNCAANNSVINTSTFDSVQISTALPSISDYRDTTGVYGDIFRDTVFVSEDPYYFGAVGLPKGLSINSSNGIISGTPLETGIFPVMLTAVNAMGSDTLLKTFTIRKADQSITFDAISDKKVFDVDFDPAASASSGLAVLYSSSDNNVATIVNNEVHIVGAGTCTIIADQSGDENYNAAPQSSQILNVKKLDQSITFNALPEKHPGDNDFDPGATASSGLPVTYLSSNAEVAVIVNNKIHLTGIGTAIITASQAGNESYNAAASVEQTLVVKKGNQTGCGNLHDRHFRFYPNPVRDKIWIQISFMVSENARILIYNQRGVLVREKNVDSTVETIDLGDLPMGVYTLKFVDGKYVLAKKFVKM